MRPRNLRPKRFRLWAGRPDARIRPEYSTIAAGQDIIGILVQAYGFGISAPSPQSALLIAGSP
jgi:hypothetical protein